MANIIKETRHTGWHNASGMILLALGAFLLLGLISYDPGDISLVQSPPNAPPTNLIGPLGAWISYLLVMLFGLCAWPVALAVSAQGFFLLFKRTGRVRSKAVWMLMLILALTCLVELQQELWSPLMRRLNIASPGGILGMLLAQNLFVRFLGTAGTAIISVVTLLVCAVFLFEIESLAFLVQVAEWFKTIPDYVKRWMAHRRGAQELLEREAQDLEKKRRKLEKAMQARGRDLARKTTVVKPEPLKKVEPEKASASLKRLFEKKKPKPKKESSSPAEELARAEEDQPLPALSATDYQLPPFDLLDPVPAKQGGDAGMDTEASARILESTLAQFGIEAEVTHAEVGPVVTSYEVLPAPGIRVERITGLSNNIALSMKAVSVRVQAPIPGKGVVGIEVPNQISTMVFLREILESNSWKSSKAALPLVLGKDVSGHDIVADLAKMPHLLIAGATGSGKSVCMNSLLAGMLMSRSPDQLRLMLVDPKMVEFSFFNELPHLVVPVITDPKKVALGLRWAINEMEKRYKLFSRVGVRNIQAFNQRPIAKQEELFSEGELESAQVPAPRPPKKEPDRLPYIVIVIDELADLMMVAQADVENAIARLAQLSRAVGIHMIIATQRPSVNVITGTIKANFPARIAFQVAQKVDSRTILDGNGADTLLGKGDMLFLPPGTGKLVRAQGTMTTDREIHEIVDFWKNQGEPQYESAIKEKIENTPVDLPEQDDEKDNGLLEQAVEILRQTRRASTSSLQRRLRIGYTRAARLMDMLEERGIVGPPNGSDPRDILIDLDGDIPTNDAGEEYDTER
ncbi:MAG: DNA translocase FtsK [Kiritimatiellae bacterium]|nr:DNA translocase FtsK [Kiritimatiellia bacterium]